MHKTSPKKTTLWAHTGRTAALTALIGAMLGTAAFAQFRGRPPGPPPPGGPRFGGPGGGPGRGMRGPRPSTAATAPLPALAAGLKLTAAQQAKIAKIQSTFSSQRRSMMPPPPPPGGQPDFRAMQGTFEKMRGMEQSADAGVQAVLTGPQRAALPGLLKTLDDLRMAGIPPATYGALKLTGAQTARIVGMAQSSQQAMSRTMSAPGSGGGPRQAMRASRDRLAAQAAAVLSPAQRAIVDKYKAAHPRPAFGGGGFGGPRGGPGGPPPGERRSQNEDHGRPVILVAQELGVTPDQFRAAFRKVHPAGAGQEPTQAQRQANRKVLSESLGVSPERLDAVMDKYRPGGRGTNGPPPQDAPPPGGDEQ